MIIDNTFYKYLIILIGSALEVGLRERSRFPPKE